MADFRRAVKKTAEQLELLQQRCAERLPESASLIFAAHFMMLKDPKFIDSMAAKIDGGIPATRAVRDVAGKYIGLFSDSPHPYIREKVSDIEDLAGRLLNNLVPPSPEGQWKQQRQGGRRPGPLPVGTAETGCRIGGGYRAGQRRGDLPCCHYRPFPEDPGGGCSVSGTAPPARRHPAAGGRRCGQCVRGPVGRHPCPVRCQQPGPATGGHRPNGGSLRVRAHNGRHVGRPAGQHQPAGGAAPGAGMGAAGIGLYRTEFPFLIRPTFPSETEQYLVYRQVVEHMGDKPVVFRTLDIGGEKTLAYSDAGKEPNPELGLRSIRFTLAYRDIFEQQLRAILRAGAGRESLGIMFPLISSVDDFLRARQVVVDCLDHLKAEGLDHHDHPAIGMMVELPAVVESMAEFAAQADFFAIGTNDFVQYMLGVDRSNKQVADYYRPEHPSVLRALERVVRVAGDHKKPISVCGEMGHDAAMIPFLLGIGIRRLSLDPAVHAGRSSAHQRPYHRALPGSCPGTDGRRKHCRGSKNSGGFLSSFRSRPFSGIDPFHLIGIDSQQCAAFEPSPVFEPPPYYPT
jgi:phosphotransferase system enzyme I (PtsP)